MLRILMNFFFGFQATLLIAKIGQSHLHDLPTSIAVYLFKSFGTVYSMTIFGKQILTLQRLVFEICYFGFPL